MGIEELLRHFKFPRAVPKFKEIPSKGEMREFYNVLKVDRDRTMFLMLATSGIRPIELLQLSRNNLNLEQRMIKSPKQVFTSKNMFITFYNDECSQVLNEYLKTLDTERIFRTAKRTINNLFKKASLESGVKILPKDLRIWFSVEMARKGIPDRYVDYFTGHVPRRILARHYTSYDVKTLKEIYDKAGLKVLS